MKAFVSKENIILSLFFCSTKTIGPLATPSAGICTVIEQENCPRKVFAQQALSSLKSYARRLERVPE
jgi:hypothetical protein